MKCITNFMKFNNSKTRVITFTRKTNVLSYAYKLRDSSVTCTDTIIDLRVQFDSKLNFHAHVDNIFSKSVRMLCLTRTVTDSISNLDSLFILHLTLVRIKHEYASAVWNSITCSDVT